MQSNLDNYIRILLVDDEKTFALNLAKLLRLRKFHVDTAFDGTRAIDIIKRSDPFHVVILDVKMPGMDGIAVLKEIKRVSFQSEVLMLTGHATLESGIQAMRCGAFDYLMKPCEIEDLCQKIHEAYQTETIKRHPVLWQRSLVKEIEKPFFIRLEEADPLRKALDIFSGGPGTVAKQTLYVVDAQNRLKGTLTKQDLLAGINKGRSDRAVSWEQLAENPHICSDLKVTDLMQATCPETADSGENLTEVAQRMIAGKVRCLPVVKDGCLTAIVRLNDILRHIEHEIE